MITENVNGLIILRAEELKKITNKDRTFFTDIIYLGINDKQENYEEVVRDIWKHFITEENPDINELKERTNDLQIEQENIKVTQDNQNQALDITMMAIDEVYTIVDSILNPVELISQGLISEFTFDTNTNAKKGVNIMVDLYVVMIQRGLKTIDEVPAKYREQVRAILESVE